MLGRAELEAYARTSAALLDLTIDPAYAPSVIDNLEVIFRHYGLLAGEPTPLETELAFEFRP